MFRSRRRDGALLVEAIALGVCGTDREIIAGDYGEAPRRRERLILGHESLGRVLEAPVESDSGPAITSSASCASPIRSPARPARPANGTCAATANTPSTASRG